MIQQLASTSLLVILALAMTACSNGKEDRKSRQPPNVSTKSCVFNVEDGDSADFSILSSDSAKVQKLETAHFGKNFRPSYLRAVGTANILSTLEFINQTAATVFRHPERIPTLDCSRDLFASIPEMPSDLAEKWAAVEGPTEESVMSGLYLPIDPAGATGLPSIQQSAAIIVRPNTNRWSLVHEFMHHLFTTQSVAEGYDEIQDEKDIDSYCPTILKNGTKQPVTSENLDHYIENLPKCFAAMDSTLIHFSLEEVAIETRMKQAVRAGHLEYVPVPNNWYIRRNLATSAYFYNLFYFAHKNTMKLIANKPDSIQDIFRSMESIVLKRLTEIEEIDSKYPDERSARSELAGISAHEEGAAGCSHSSKITKLMKLVGPEHK